MTSVHLRTRITLATLTVMVLAALLMAACSAPASGEALGGGPGASASGPAGGAGATGDATGATDAATAGGRKLNDWDRALAALAAMRAETPAKPVVILLGGSAARESTISDASWRRQIVAAGGPETLAWNMGSSNRTMAQNLAIVRALPEGVEVIVYVGINLGAFTSPKRYASIRLPSPAPSTGEVPLQQFHKYSTRTGVLPVTKKKALVKQWLTDRYPVFKRNFASGAGVLEKLLQTCEDRGYKPVLLELPRNSSVIGAALNAPTTKYRDKCRRLAAEYGVKWVPQLAVLPNRDFYDLWHLVEPGREVWQGKLSARTAALLKLYGFDGGGS